MMPGFFADEANLNLLTWAELRQVAQAALPRGEFRFQVETITLAGWPSNLLLMIHRQGTEASRAARPPVRAMQS